jgi:hypothetical protein
MACKLVPAANTRDFEAPAGEPVRLVTKDAANVLIEAADYAGHEVVPSGHPVNSMQLTVAPGPNMVDIVFVFRPGTNDGELHEDCGSDSHLLRRVSHDDPFKSFFIIGK